MSDVLSGVITVTTAGTAVQATTAPGSRFVFKALSTNAGIIYIGNDGENDVASSNGFHLLASDAVEVTYPLGNFWVDASSNGDAVAWVRVQ